MRRKLDLLVQHHPRAGQKGVPEAGIHLGLVGKHDDIFALGDGDRAVDDQPVGGPVIADALCLDPHVALQRLDMALGDEAGLAFEEDLIGHQHGGLLRRCRRSGRCRGRRDAGQDREAERQDDGQHRGPAGGGDAGGQAARHPSSVCRSRPMPRSAAATGGAQAASRIGIWPFSPRIWAKLRT